MIKIILSGEPIAKMRARFLKNPITYKNSSKKKFAIDPQHAQKHAAKFQILTQINRTNLPFDSCVPIEIEVIFYFEIHESKKNLFDWDLMDHLNKPDIDNLEKWVFDVLNGIIYSDDRQIFRCTSKKEYCETPRTEIYIMPKAPKCSDQVKEVLNMISPDYFCELAADLSYIADIKKADCVDPHDDFEEIAYLICEFAEKHADNLKKINKKFPGLAKVLKEKLENK